MDERMDDTCSSGSDSEWIGIEDESDDYSLETKCLFCHQISNTPEVMFQHCRSEHSFDLVAFHSKLSLDSISYIKFVNFSRLKMPSPSDLQGITKQSVPWDCDEFMKPADPLDPLLTFDFEDYIKELEAERGNPCLMVTLPQSELNSLIEKMKAKDLQLQQALEAQEKMKKAAHEMLLSNSSKEETQRNHRIEESRRNTCREESRSNSYYEQDTRPNNYSDGDDYYFSTYDHFSIHHEMLQDKVRTLSYRDAIMTNKELFRGKTVMDVGCGTGILSMFAASAGAKRVIAIDKSDIIYNAMDIVRENGFDEVIDLCKGRVEDVRVPDHKVDIIVSEWMGYFLLFEGMLDSVLYARDTYLASGGLMFPDRCTLHVVAISDITKHREYVSYWDNVYGYRMSVMKREVIKEANIEAVKGEVVCSNSVVVKDLDLYSCDSRDFEFISNFELVMTKDCKVTAVVGYFESIFEQGLIHKVSLSTSPTSTPTHWKQTVFLLPDPVNVSCGQRIFGKVSCRRNRRDPRSLIIRIDFGNCSNLYYLS